MSPGQGKQPGEHTGDGWCDGVLNDALWVAGYEHPVDQVVEDLLSCLDDPALALLQWNEAFGVVQVRCMPTNLTYLHACCTLTAHSQDRESLQ